MAREGGEEKSRGMVSATGFGYSEVQAHLVNQIQSSFDSNPEIYNLTTGVNMIAFPPKHTHHPGGPSSSSFSSKTIHHSSAPDYYPHDFSANAASHVMAPWHDNRLLLDDSSLRCVFPCEGNERPSQGLSLSLSSANPTSIGVRSFELSHAIPHHHHQADDMRFYGEAGNVDDGSTFQVRSSKYLGPAQELLNEFCNLGGTDYQSKQKTQKSKQWEEENNSACGPSRKQSLHALELMELQKRKAKLLSMLEEVDRRYRHYCDQMKAVVSSFETVAGNGAASVYSALASKVMSKHFRCLRDGIVGQIRAIKKAMGEKDPIAPGTSRGETPRLRLLDQTLRQQKALQQMNMMESHPWRPQRGLPERSVSVLRAWLFEHFLHPYPSDVDKHILARQTGLSRSQVSNWFINARVRLWKPMVEEMYLEETKEPDNMGSSDGVPDFDNGRPNQCPKPPPEDQKPTPDQLVRIESECLSSIINNPERPDGRSSTKSLQSPSFGRVATEAYGAMELDFSSYHLNHTAASASYAHENTHHDFGGGGGRGGNGGGVSLTLGLQQHGGSGLSLAFSPASQNSLFYSRDHIDDCQTVQYSLLDGEAQNLPYRNLMGAQLLHDLAG